MTASCRDLRGDALLLVERERDRSDVVGEASICGAATAGMITSSPESRRYCTIIIAWFRSSTAWLVEVRGELRQGLGVVVDGDRDVLLRGRELVRDLLVELLLEGGHAWNLARPADAGLARLASRPRAEPARRR